MRMHICCILFVAAFIVTSYLPQETAITVNFICRVNRMQAPVDSNIPIKRVKVVDGDTVLIEADSISIDELFAIISFEQSVRVTAFRDHSYWLFGDNTLGSGINMHTPDSIVFRDGAWFSVKQQTKTIIPIEPLEFHNTGEKKNILGFSCIKFTASSAGSNHKYVIWATSSLPQTLLPMSGLKPFGYGILEMEEASGAWSVRPVNVVKSTRYVHL
jgi:hypothetical protein